MAHELTTEVQAIVAKVEKLLRLAAKNPNEAEAASATAKAQELLAAYNLDMAAVERNSGDTGKRAEENLAGGRFEWERDLWKAVAELNFCLYWNQIVFIQTALGQKVRWKAGKQVRGIEQHQHRLVGRTVNVASTKAMASYLEGVADRLTRERCTKAKESPRSRWAMSFREGISMRIEEKIYERRRELLDEDVRKRRDAEAAARTAEAAGVSTSTAITISSYVQSEWDANVDFVYGEGASATWAAERAAKAAAERRADEEYTAWAAAHPKEAARENARREKEAERLARRERTASGRRFKGDINAFYAGYAEGDSVSLDMQTEGRKTAGLIR